MDNQSILDKIQPIIIPVLQDAGVELVEIDLVRASGQTIVRVLIDKIGGGINLDECAIINRRLSDIFEQEDFIADRHVVEVSSPGLDRPLKSRNDFLRCLNKKAKFFLREPINGKIEWDGIIKNVSETEVSVEIEGKIVNLPLLIINKAKLLF